LDRLPARVCDLARNIDCLAEDNRNQKEDRYGCIFHFNKPPFMGWEGCLTDKITGYTLSPHPEHYHDAIFQRAFVGLAVNNLLCRLSEIIMPPGKAGKKTD
jgi:hypothetical protein